METVKKQADQIVILEETLQKTQDQEQMYAEAMENLQAEYDALEQENIKLKKSVSKKEEKRISLPKKSEFSLNESVALEIESINTNEVSSEVRYSIGCLLLLFLLLFSFFMSLLNLQFIYISSRLKH
jgi:dynactin 1